MSQLERNAISPANAISEILTQKEKHGKIKNANEMGRKNNGCRGEVLVEIYDFSQGDQRKWPA